MRGVQKLSPEGIVGGKPDHNPCIILSERQKLEDGEGSEDPLVTVIQEGVRRDIG